MTKWYEVGKVLTPEQKAAVEAELRKARYGQWAHKERPVRFRFRKSDAFGGCEIVEVGAEKATDAAYRAVYAGLRSLIHEGQRVELIRPIHDARVHGDVHPAGTQGIVTSMDWTNGVTIRLIDGWEINIGKVWVRPVHDCWANPVHRYDPRSRLRDSYWCGECGAFLQVG